jgi:hypothetical protein
MKISRLAIMMVCAMALPLAAQAAGNKAITKAQTKIVRGMNGLSCDATAIGNGNDPHVGPKTELTNLSVSCSDDTSVSYSQLRAPLPNPHACVSTLGSLRKQNRTVAVVRDGNNQNPYHCLLQNITPNQVVAGSKFQN